MQDYQKGFIRFALAQGALRFGEFELKSGRISPYFFNAGMFASGKALAQLGEFYASAIQAAGVDYDLIFGPAYKGIPLASAAAIALANQYNIDKPYAFNRKEAKDHGEGGLIVGSPLQGRVLIVDDVITAGTAIREVMTILDAHQAQAAGVVIALDRQEVGQGKLSAIQEVEQQFAMPVVSIIGLCDLISYLAGEDDMAEHLERIQAYQDQYGI